MTRPGDGWRAIRVVIAEDHDMLRHGLRQWLQEGDMDVVGEAIDGEGALEQIEMHQPDVVLMDITMPGMDGLVALEEAHRRFPDVRIAMLSVHADDERVLRAIRAGASGYLLKNIAVNELLAAVRVVASGSLYLASSVSRHVVDALAPAPAPVGPSPSVLSPRQLEVLRLIAAGLTSNAIAVELGISSSTVDTHRTQLMDRLQIHDIAGLVRYAAANRLVDLDG